MADILGLTATAIYNQLVGNSGLSAVVGTRVFDTQAPSGTAYPLVIFQFSAGGDMNDSPRRDIESEWRIECIGKALADARNGAAAIDGALYLKKLTIPGWSNYWCAPVRLFGMTENTDGVQYFRRGAFYKISFDLVS